VEYFLNMPLRILCDFVEDYIAVIKSQKE